MEETSKKQIDAAPSLPNYPPGPIGLQQLTQVAHPIPPEVWTTEALMKFHELNAKVNLDNNEKFHDIALDNNLNTEKAKRREHILSAVFLGILGIIILAGIFFMYKGIGGGKEIILGAGSFIAGLLAGRGTK